MWNKFIIVLVIILGAVAIAQLMKLNEIATRQANKKEYEIPQNENNFNAWMMLVFGGIFLLSMVYLIFAYGYSNLGPAASTYGETIDFIFDINWVIVLIVLFVCNALLYYFGWKYARRPGSKAYYFPHKQILEVLWTTIPAGTLTILIIIGLYAWNKITSRAGAEYVNVEIFSEQFSWTARYSGSDNKLGNYDYKLTTATNKYGLATKENIQKSLHLMKVGELGTPGVEMIEKKLNNPDIILSNSERSKLEDELASKSRMVDLLTTMEATYADSLDRYTNNDIIVEDTLVMLKGQKYNFHFRSKDVIHSAYFPQFRQQMNTVPGMTTYAKIQPIYTTKEMQKIMNDPNYQFALLCNKVCGTSHYKMEMPIKVLGPKEYLAWQKRHKTYDGSDWIQGNEKALLDYYTKIANSVDKDNK